jgi:thiamine biosynthesis lipoprotein
VVGENLAVPTVDGAGQATQLGDLGVSAVLVDSHHSPSTSCWAPTTIPSILTSALAPLLLLITVKGLSSSPDVRHLQNGGAFDRAGGPDDTRPDVFDPGGIGKGRAVDLAIERCRELGLAMASIELGSDLRVYGAPWFGDEWTMGVANPFRPDSDVATFTMSCGAVATSTTVKRGCVADGLRFHHLLDPATGNPSSSDIVSVTACSEEAWWAEVVARSTLLVGSNRAIGLLDELGVPGAVVTRDGTVFAAGGRSASHQPPPRHRSCSDSRTQEPSEVTA